jgi:predicted nucleic acid-binding protein
MKFWDSSAIVPLLVEEDRTADARRLLSEDQSILASQLTPVEVSSALWRKRHANELTSAAHEEAERMFAEISRRWREISHAPEMVAQALDLLSRHPLRSMDALQLAAAMFASGTTARIPIVTFDRRFAAAARAEGFAILP